MIFSKGRIAATVLGAMAIASCGPAAASVAPATIAPASIAETTGAPSSPSPTSTPAPSPSATSVSFVDLEWHGAARMVQPRTGFDAVVLGDGTVLAVGDDFACYPGPAASGSETAERYDPTGDAWLKAPSLNKPRKEPATVVLADGSAIVVGGLNDAGQAFSSTKEFEPGAGTWTDGPLMVLARETPLAVTLPDGAVFVVSETSGGFTSERLDPTTFVWKKAASLPSHARIDDMVSLSGGLVLAIGSDTGSGSESTPAAYRYDPASGTWTPVQGLAQSSVELVALPDGTALAIGGIDGNNAITARVQRFDGRTGAWTQVAPMSTPRSLAQAVVLPDGQVLVAGGSTGKDFANGTALRSTELYDPAADRWIPGKDLLEARYGGQALALRDGSVLILGGANDFNSQGEAPWCPTPLVTTERLGPRP